MHKAGTRTCALPHRTHKPANGTHARSRNTHRYTHKTNRHTPTRTHFDGVAAAEHNVHTRVAARQALHLHRHKVNVAKGLLLDGKQELLHRRFRVWGGFRVLGFRVMREFRVKVMRGFKV